jgi:hypothetical protein
MTFSGGKMNQTLLDAKQAGLLIAKGQAPENMQVRGALKIAGNRKLETLPAGLTADSLDASGCLELRELPADLKVRRLNVSGCKNLRALPQGLHLFELEARETPLQALPADLKVEFRLDLSESAIETLPVGLKTGSLVLRGCTGLQALPEKLDVYFLDIAGCSCLKNWPQEANVRIGRLVMAGCTRLHSLPSWLKELSQLDVADCENLRELPAELRIASWLDLGGSGLTHLPENLQNTPLRWRGVPVDERIAFRPETITVEEIFEEQNTEKRRVLLERMGYEKFLSEARAMELDKDRDAGGVRRLLRVEFAGDEPLVCLNVFCPSTGRQYMLRVPPQMRHCHAAAAWIAGFDNPDEYQPVQET